MPNPGSTESAPAAPEANDFNESFADLLSQFEQSHVRIPGEADRQIEATVVTLSADSIFFDIGFKSEGILPLTALRPGETFKPGDKLPVSVKGRDPDGYYELTRFKIAQPRDWIALEQAFTGKATIVGTVTAVIKGGLSVDVGVRAFMPASRTGTRDAIEMEKLVGQEIRCRITKLDVTAEDVVVDRRAVVEEEERSAQEHRYAEMKEGDTVHGIVRSLADYGAFVDIGGVDGLLHVSDIAWARTTKPADVLAVGQQIEARVLKIDLEKHRISLGLKQLQPPPWDSAAGKYKVGERVRGTVTRTTDFGAFVEIEPGIEGLIHISEFSWAKKTRKPSDMLKPGETVEAVVLGVNVNERRISLGLKQALGDPWIGAAQRFAPGSVLEGPITSITNFGAFVELAPGIEGMIHVSEISAEKHIDHPRDVFRVGQIVKALVLEIDSEKRQLRLSIKQLVPSNLEEYLAEHKAGDIVTGRILEVNGESARVELGEGILASSRVSTEVLHAEAPSNTDLASLTSMLKAHWKSGSSSATARLKSAHAGQVRSFRIVKLDQGEKKLELDLVP